MTIFKSYKKKFIKLNIKVLFLFVYFSSLSNKAHVKGLFILVRNTLYFHLVDVLSIFIRTHLTLHQNPFLIQVLPTMIASLEPQRKSMFIRAQE